MIFEYFQQHFQTFLIIFARIFGLLLTLPVLSSGIPAFSRAGLSFFTALLSAPMIIGEKMIPSNYSNLMEFGIIVLSSLLIGLIIGFIVQITISGIQLSGAVFSTTIGLTLSESLDPLTQTEAPVIGNLISVLIMLLFIRTESHIIFIEMIILSFRNMPVLDTSTLSNFSVSLKAASAVILILAFKISLPIIAVTMLLDTATGIIGRVAPQFNIMIMGWNIKIIAGFIILWMILPGIMDFGTTLFKELFNSIAMLLKIKN
ncbi:MAG: flagellar biosynthetic protein FliR [Brevinemataceae bacterium]